MRLKKFDNRLTCYLTAVVAVALAVLLTWWLKRFGDAGISPPFFAAVLVSAWFGGLGPGLVATLLSGGVSAYLLMSPPAGNPSEVGSVLLRPLVFTLVAFLASSLHAATRRAAAESDRAKQAAESANDAKSRFLAMVSHELRTPLSPVLMLTEMLEGDPALSEETRRDIQSIRRHVDVELRLIDDLVDLTRITSGKMKLQLEPTPIEAPLRAAVEICNGELRAKSLHLILSLNAADAQVLADGVRLQQVFWNLLRNAIKFTPAGGDIRVSAAITPSGMVDIRVSDTGIGIDPHRLTAIFQPFEQEDAEVSHRFGGLGLGLAICQALIHEHDGSINATSEGKSRGATFTVCLPLLARRLASTDPHLLQISKT